MADPTGRGRASFRASPYRERFYGCLLAAALLPGTAGLAVADPPPWIQTAHTPETRAPARTQLAYRFPAGLKDGRCRPEMFKAAKVAGLANAARKGLSRTRRTGVKGRADPMDGTALGALMAALGDDGKGSTLNRREVVCFSQSFEHIPDRSIVAWFDAATAVHYSLMPIRTLRTSDGQFCREYTAKATLNGHAADVYGTACRRPDGRWALID